MTIGKKERTRMKSIPAILLAVLFLLMMGCGDKNGDIAEVRSIPTPDFCAYMGYSAMKTAVSRDRS